MPNDPESIEALRQNWRAEVETSRVYRDLAERETDQKRKSILLRMAEAEERHATRWAEKLTELGASSFQPLGSSRSVVQPREAKLDKLQRYVIEASKQCGRNVLMQIHPVMNWSDYCRRTDLAALGAPT